MSSNERASIQCPHKVASPLTLCPEPVFVLPAYGSIGEGVRCAAGHGVRELGFCLIDQCPVERDVLAAEIGMLVGNVLQCCGLAGSSSGDDLHRLAEVE